jgi:hypothetical protein
MSAESTRCPKCNGEMVQGFIFGYHAGGKRLVNKWVEGAPKKSWWRVTKIPAEKCIPCAGHPPRCGLHPGRPRTAQATSA